MKTTSVLLLVLVTLSVVCADNDDMFKMWSCHPRRLEILDKFDEERLGFLARFGDQEQREILLKFDLEQPQILVKFDDQMHNMVVRKMQTHPDVDVIGDMYKRHVAGVEEKEKEKSENDVAGRKVLGPFFPDGLRSRIEEMMGNKKV